MTKLLQIVSLLILTPIFLVFATLYACLAGLMALIESIFFVKTKPKGGTVV